MNETGVVRRKKSLQGPHLLSALQAIFNFAKNNRNVTRRQWSSLRRLHARTNGRSSQILTKLIGWIYRPPRLTPQITSQVLNVTMTKSEVEEICDEISEGSCATLPCTLSPEHCNDLIAYAKMQPATPQIPIEGMEGHHTLYDPDNIRAPVYNWFSQQVGEHPVFQSISTDPLLYAIAARYLNCKPLLYSALMWVSPISSGQNLSEAAQMFHFDFDGTKFLKFFFYLNDVGEHDGPHVMIPGSHWPDKLGRNLRAYDGRFTDAEIYSLYPEAARTIAGKCGTIFAEDTSCWHKGEPPTGKERWLLQICYSSFLNGDDTANLFREATIAKKQLTTPNGCA
jgi:hypothetical protein